VESHDKETHNLVPCKHCRRDFEAKLLSDHVEVCPQKPKFCQFCNCEISSHEYLDHIYQCGSRTRQCTFCNKSILVRDLEPHEAACEVEQFTRQEAGLDEFEENDEEISLPPRRGAVQETKAVPRKRFEPVRKEPVAEQNKKRLTKLSNIQGSLEDDELAQITSEEFERDIGIVGGRRQRGYERQKTQEEIDEELAKELNDEFYHGRNANKKKINEKSRTKVFQENVEDFDNELEEEFYGTKKEKRLTRNDKKKAMEEEEEFSNTTRRNHLSRNAKKKANPYSYEEEENYDYEEEEEAEYEPTEDQPTRKATSQRRNDIDPEMHQFLDENDDAELQRAIQLSLQSFQN